MLSSAVADPSVTEFQLRTHGQAAAPLGAPNLKPHT